MDSQGRSQSTDSDDPKLPEIWLYYRPLVHRRNAFQGPERFPKPINYKLIRKFIVNLDSWGLEDENIVVIRENYIKNKTRDFKEMDEAMAYNVHYVICEPYKMSQVVTRWIVVGNFLLSAALHSSYATVIMSYFWPNRPWLYWPPFIVSCLTTLIYDFSWAKDPCSNYQVLTNPFIYARFPVHRLDSGKAEVYRLEPYSMCRLHHHIVFFIGLMRVLYYTLNPAPPCICDWNMFQLFRKAPIMSAEDATSGPPWYMKYMKFIPFAFMMPKKSQNL